MRSKLTFKLLGVDLIIQTAVIIIPLILVGFTSLLITFTVILPAWQALSILVLIIHFKKREPDLIEYIRLRSNHIIFIAIYGLIVPFILFNPKLFKFDGLTLLAFILGFNAIITIGYFIFTIYSYRKLRNFADLAKIIPKSMCSWTKHN